MAGKAPSVKAPPPPEFRPYGLQALRRDVPRGNPFELSFDRAQTMFTTRLDFTLRSPALPNLEHAYTVGRLKLTRIELNDGSVLTPPVAAAAGARPAAWETALRFGTTPKDGVLTKSLYLLVDAKPAPETIRAVAGVLTLQLPRTIRTLRVEDLTPGSETATAGMLVTVTARGHRSLTLRAAANGERVLHVALTAVGGQPVASFNPTITESPDGAWTFQLSPYGAPAYADVTFATSVERKDYPFRLERP
jgi:hypothetical protein